MKDNTKIVLTIAAVFIAIFVLNFAISTAYSGAGFYMYALVNGIVLFTVIFLILKVKKLS